MAFAGPPGRVGALLVAGYRDDGALELVGQVGTGFSAVMRRQLFEALQFIDGRAGKHTHPFTPPALGGTVLRHG